MLQAGNKESFNPYMAALQEVLQLNVAYVRGEGTRLFDAQGRIYLDFVAGFGSVPFGHNPPALNQALVAFAQTGEPSMVQVSAMPAAQALTSKLLSFMPQELDTVWFCNSGTEAVEAAIKAARAATGCYRIISARNGFHGKTLGALAATHRRKYQEPFLTAESVDEAFVQVDFGDIASLNQALEQHAGKVAAILLEPVQGEGGAVVPPAGYLRAVRTLCDQHKVILVLDEIQTGFWRTGPRFAAEAEQVVPDIMVLAKALGGGLVPIGACVMKRSVYSEEFGMKHSSTFGGNGLCARIAYTALEEFERQQTLLERNVNDRAQQLYAAHRSLLQRFPRVVRGISGRGLLQGVHLALDREQIRQRRGNILCVLSEQEKLIPLVCSYLLNVHSIRLAPALNKGQVLRVEPPLTVSEAECEVYIAALTRAVELLNAGNTAALCAHFVGLSDADIQQEGGTATPAVDARDFSLQGDDASLEKIAFLLHPIDYKSFIDFDQSLASFDRRQLKALSQMLATNIEPFLYGADRITTRNGAAVYCEFISLSHTAESLIEMGSKAAEMEVAKAVDLARSRGVRLVGLGGFTSVVTQGGRKVLDRGVAITSGNSFTVVSAIDAVQMACRQLGKSLVDCRVAVVGAGGSIGSAVVRLLLPQVKQLVLVGNQSNAGKSLRRITTSVTGALGRYLCEHNNATALAATLVSYALEHGLDGRDSVALAACVEDWLKRGCHDGLQFTMDLESGLSNADIVVCATSATGDLIYPDFLKHAAVVCDMSRPSNTSHRIREERPDVLVIDGGVVEIPNKLDIDTYFGFPQGTIYACMAETIMLGLAGKFENTSIGHQLDAETLDYLRDAAKDFGFKLARLRSFDRPLTSRDWLHIKKFHKLEAAAHSVPATERSAYSPAAANSLTECALVNVVQLLLDRHVARNGSKTAVMVDGGSITYAKLWRKSCQVAHALRQRKLQAGDRVSIIAYDCLETVIVMLAVQRLGMAAVIHNPFYQSEELKAAIASAAPNLVLVSERCEQHQQLLNLDNGPCGCLELFVQQASVDFADMEPPSPCMVPAGTAAVCHFTSGTTGSPSLVVHSHRDIINTNVGYAEKVLGLTESDVTFTASRLFFAYGYNSLHMALFRGATSILVPAQAKAPILHEIIACQKPTVFFGVPTVYLLLLRYHTQTTDLSSVRLFVSAGEPLSEDIYFAWRMRFGREVIDGIGCTESLSTYISNWPGATLAGATGRIVPGFEIKILNDTGQLAKRGEIGSLWLRGNTLAKSINADANEWFCTNDMVAMDEQGIVFYVGRANDILKVGGCWVSPMVIEQAVMQHPQVADCAVVEKVEMGALTRPVVYVVPADVSIMWDRQFATRLKQFCIDRLPPQHYPHFVEFIDAIPRTVNGKVQRFKLRNLQMSQYAALAGF
jgi:acetylornithine/succinyldiaminopimelate/putrescine aminotransferase/acyl-coenzyme A synthetase/AMP-(fatty) acid ligase/predicted amino acid dehydrogenase